ncbi:MAG TPA: PAS domain S-box protein [Gammaproteobacteria bacterium]
MTPPKAARKPRAKIVTRAELESRRSDASFDRLFDGLPHPAYIWQRCGDDFELIRLSRAAVELPFSEGARLLGRKASDLQAASGGTHDLLSDLRTCLDQNVIVRRDVDHPYIASGVVRRLSVTIVPLTPTTAVMHTVDITDRERAEEALRESERTYRTIVDTANEGIVAVDAEGRITYANQRAADLLGRSVAELVGSTGDDLLDDELRGQAQTIRARLRAGHREQFDWKLQHKDGTDLWISSSAAPIFDKTGRYAGSIVMISDVTSRHRAEQALRESEAKVRALVDANPDMIVRVTGDGEYLDIHLNDACVEAFLPVPSQDFIGRKVSELFEPEFARQHEKYRRAALETGQMQLWEYTRHNRHIEARFVKSGDDEVVITVRDLTERVQLEREVIASVERERERVGHDLHDGLAQLLTGVKLLLQPLKDRLAAEGSRHAETVERAAELVSQAIKDTSDLARGLSPMPKGATFGDALRQLAQQSEHLLGVTCAVDDDGAPKHLDDDAAMHVYRIAQEAITNAARHGRATRIEVRCTADSERFYVTITDNGIGMQNAQARGAGMGLRIMNYRARRIGGDLTFACNSGGGTVVSLVCPLFEVAA